MAMKIEEVRDSLRGVAAGLLTPFDDELDIAHEKLHENANTLYEQGIRTFLGAANISEYHSLSRDERVGVIETSVDALPDDTCVIAGVGGSTKDAQELARGYADAGADALMVMPPHHAFVHERGLLQYYRELASATDLTLAPYIRGFVPSVDFLGDLTRIEGVAGIKFALEDPSLLSAGVAAGTDDVIWIDGLAEPYAVPFWAAGAEGFSAGVSNFRPEVGLALFEALRTEEFERARSLAAICGPYQRFRGTPGEGNSLSGGISIPVVKKGLELAGLYGGRVREPLISLTTAEERRVEALYDELDDHINTHIG